MAKRGRGVVIHVSSIQRKLPLHDSTTAYAAAKAALTTYSKALSKELGPSGVRVNVVSPAIIETALSQQLAATVSGGKAESANAQFGAGYPMGRVGEPREVADVVVWLCSENASFITSQNITIDGGAMEK